MSSKAAPSRLVKLGAALCVSLMLAGCGGGGPPPVTYVLGPPAPAIASIEPLTGRPVIEVKHVLVPDYLDVSDIMVRRSENVASPSATGRWGERLSAGLTRVLAYDLSRRLPGFVVTATPVGNSAIQVLVDIEDFAPRSDGTVVMLAQWHMLDGSSRGTIAGEQISLTGRAAGSGDAAIAAVMTREVDDLAARVAAGVQREGRRGRPPVRGRTGAIRSGGQAASAAH